VKYGEYTWAAVKGYLDEVTATAAALHLARNRATVGRDSRIRTRMPRRLALAPSL
jgi:hypothetical protein